MTSEGFEIDYLPVGKGKLGGDAIVVKFGDLNSGDRSKYNVVVIDGGTIESGESIVEHLEEFTGSKSIDLVVATHSDNDHICGLEPVIENCAISAVLMHAPWIHAESLKFIKSLDKAREIHELLSSKGIPHYDPLVTTEFFGGTLKVLGPSVAYYLSLLPQFDGSQKMLATSTKQTVTETRDPATETLDDAHKYTSATNNSSVITLFDFAGKKALFTGDAGVEAIKLAIKYADSAGISLENIRFFDVPHHGSHHNITTELIDHFKPEHSFVSGAKLAERHPHPRVLNAFHRRDLPIFTTAGDALRHSFNAPSRTNWVPASVSPFVERFEA